jgi:hypothetical protein
LSKTADEVVEAVFDRASAEDGLGEIAAALRRLWQAGEWSAESIDKALGDLRADE